ncbi:PhzF family phenazine biosynthesis protein [Xanthovirga aplysinae]|uniref:PhzF family phenazine biosynthesis protein n=1 Tax=Xanthovirga aplysinae TaxID=2529853 RepID=UPI0012BD450D|nr:PhzF family phenazine biosynthesis protein [Xanthovirga aplysinae]MTI29968.1 PhzF family phenazine biosynthesis protein [Xanthovirga aplysinae]
MKLEIYQIDTFTDKIFGGNPACVVPLKYWLPDKILLKISQENAVAETAFFIEREDHIHLRWFTPDIEMDLCGHATLATAHVLNKILGHQKEKIIFKTLSGDLSVSIEKELYTLDFPSREPSATELPDIIKRSLNIQPKTVLKSRDYLLVYETEKDIINITIDRQIFDQINLDPGGVIVTSKGSNCDFVSRFFTPQSSILEDPVTGSAHCSLIPYWSEQLRKKKLTAKQLSDRGGDLLCVDNNGRVLISGKAKTYSVGYFFTE